MAWATTTIDELLPAMRRDIPEAPEVALLAELRDTVADFCTRTLYWRETLGPIALAEDAQTVEFSLPAGLEVRQVAQLEVSADETQLFATVAVVPAMDSDLIGRLIVSRWKSAIVAGAIARMLMMPRKVWTDPALSKLHDETYEDAVTAATIEANNGYNTMFRNPGMTYSDF